MPGKRLETPSWGHPGHIAGWVRDAVRGRRDGGASVPGEKPAIASEAVLGQLIYTNDSSQGQRGQENGWKRHPGAARDISRDRSGVQSGGPARFRAGRSRRSGRTKYATSARTRWSWDGGWVWAGRARSTSDCPWTSGKSGWRAGWPSSRRPTGTGTRRAGTPTEPGTWRMSTTGCMRPGNFPCWAAGPRATPGGHQAPTTAAAHATTMPPCSTPRP